MSDKNWQKSLLDEFDTSPEEQESLEEIFGLMSRYKPESISSSKEILGVKKKKRIKAWQVAAAALLLIWSSFLIGNTKLNFAENGLSLTFGESIEEPQVLPINEFKQFQHTTHEKMTALIEKMDEWNGQKNDLENIIIESAQKNNLQNGIIKKMESEQQDMKKYLAEGMVGIHKYLQSARIEDQIWMEENLSQMMVLLNASQAETELKLVSLLGDEKVSY